MLHTVFHVLDKPTRFLSENIGSELTGTRLFFTLLYVYPLIFIERLLLPKKSPDIKHLFYTISAAVLLYYNFGAESIHFFINVTIVYLLFVTLPVSRKLLILSWIINMGYLLTSYFIKRVTDKYGVTWSTPQCVLTLKLLSITWYLYDKAANKKEDSVITRPRLLEVLGFVCYPPALMAGPPITYTHYLKFVRGEFEEYMPTRWQYGMTRIVLGFVIMFSFPLLNSYITTTYLFTPQFKESATLIQMLYVAVWGQVILTRYVGVWLLAEGSCVLSGISYNGLDNSMTPIWDGCANIHVWRFLTAYKSQHIIESFNVNTNRWVLDNVYKRLKFMNNKMASQIISLLFLASWHGIASGYFMCFFLEFIVMYNENQLESFSRQILGKPLLDIPVVMVTRKLITKFISTFTLGYALLSFEMFYHDRYLQIYRSMYFIVHVLYITLPFVYLPCKVLLASSSHKSYHSTKDD